MAMNLLNTAGLAHLDGGMFAAVVDGAIKRAVYDIADRITVPGPRKVVVELAFTPSKINHADKEVEQINITYSYKESHPAKKSGTVNCSVKKNGTLQFNDLSQDNVDQRTIDEAGG